jgi:hypothetical protein
MDLFAVDPGYEESALVVYRPDIKVVERAIILPNQEMLDLLQHHAENYIGDVLVIEGISNYGMAVGKEIINTIFWSGRFFQAWHAEDERVDVLSRADVKLQICNNRRAKDGEIRREIIDRFGGDKRAFGRKSAPGPLFGVTSHKMAAFAVALAWWDINGKNAEGR